MHTIFSLNGGIYMTKVIKKDGRIEDFNKDKMLTSISNCADDVNIVFNKKDLDIIGTEVEKKLGEIRNDGSNTSSFEIRAVLVDVLDRLGFKKAVNAYIEGRLIKKSK